MQALPSLMSIPVIKALIWEIVEIAASSYGKGGSFREGGVGIHISWHVRCSYLFLVAQ
jgi:hypothetical protein